MTVDPAFGHWLAGFADGEGHFRIKRISSRYGNWYICAFQLALRSDDHMILEEIRDRTGLGSIVAYREPAEDARGYVRNPQVSWEVARKAEAAALVEIFDLYPLRAKKARDYALWRDAVQLWMTLVKGDRWHGRSRVSEQLYAYKVALEAGRAFEAPDAIVDDGPEQLWLDVV